MAKNEACPEALRALTKQEVAAMWLYHELYARLGIGIGAIAFYKNLGQSQKNNIDRMIKEIKGVLMKTIYKWTGEYRPPELGEWILWAGETPLKVTQEFLDTYAEVPSFWILHRQEIKEGDEDGK